MKWKRCLRVLAGFGCFAVAGFLALCWLAASRLICPERRPLQNYHREILEYPNEHGLRVAPYTVKGSDGYDTPCLLCEPSRTPGVALKGNKLRGELLAAGLTLPPWGKMTATLVLLHGHSCRKEDMLPVAERFCAAGFRCLLADLPGHGDSPAPFATFGHQEAALPAEVLQEAARRFGFQPQPAALFGISQGGAIALQAATRPGENWFAVVELSTFASLSDLIDEQSLRYFGPLHAPANLIMRWLVSRRAGFEIATVRPIDAAAQLQQPVLIGHGDADPFISPKNGRRLFQAVPGTRKEFLDIPGATHSTVLVTAAPVYATLCHFFLRARQGG